MAGTDTPQFAPGDPDQGAGSSPRAKPVGGRRVSEAWFGMLGQLDFDIDFFERLLARRGHAVDVLRILAELVSRKGDLQRAVDLDGRLVELQPDDFLARYNFACSLARAGRADEAIDALSRAILLGYDDLAHMESDPDLESLREHPDFQALLGDG
ncbi:MAG: tetratricopeptide repeat protein [Planctomycetes bacterium]|nr:tetratricopeptide repeat protein [Planctomycetota bacterium]